MELSDSVQFTERHYFHGWDDFSDELLNELWMQEFFISESTCEVMMKLQKI